MISLDDGSLREHCHHVGVPQLQTTPSNNHVENDELDEKALFDQSKGMFCKIVTKLTELSGKGMKVLQNSQNYRVRV